MHIERVHPGSRVQAYVARADSKDSEGEVPLKILA
jgi:hypothetical protein